MYSTQYVSDLSVTGQNFIEYNYKKLKSCFKKVFADKRLCKKLDLNNWPEGKKNNRAKETIKTLKYLFKNLHATYKSNDKKLRCSYCNAVNQYISLIKLAHNACFDVNTLDLLRDLLEKFLYIQKLDICKCKIHYKASNTGKSSRKSKPSKISEDDESSSYVSPVT